MFCFNIFIAFFFCLVHAGMFLPVSSSEPLWWNDSVAFALQGTAVISCFHLSLRFFHPVNVGWYSQGIFSNPLKRDNFISPLMKISLAEAQHWFCPSAALAAAQQIPAHLPNQGWLWCRWKCLHRDLRSAWACPWGVSWSLPDRT